MNDYFTPIDFDFFNQEFCLKVGRIADDILSKIGTQENVLPEYEYTHNTKILFYCDIIKQLPILDQFLSTINANVTGVPLLGFVPPNSLMGVHVDRYGCSTKILLPIKGTDPLYFYKNLNDNTPVSTYIPEINSAIIFNADNPHGGVQTSNEWRVNFQIMLSEPYEVILDRIKNNVF